MWVYFDNKLNLCVMKHVTEQINKINIIELKFSKWFYWGDSILFQVYKH